MEVNMFTDKVYNRNIFGHKENDTFTDKLYRYLGGFFLGVLIAVFGTVVRAYVDRQRTTSLAKINKRLNEEYEAKQEKAKRYEDRLRMERMENELSKVAERMKTNESNASEEDDD
jgi:uncharacterized membrane protein (DUF106 family)